MEAEKIIQGPDGKKFKVGQQPITGFKSSHWYCWTGPKKRRPKGWIKTMDFMRDGKPHRCNVGTTPTRAKGSASFYDSPGSPNTAWFWGGSSFKHFRECIPID